MATTMRNDRRQTGTLTDRRIRVPHHPRPDYGLDLGRIVLYRPPGARSTVVPAVICATAENTRAYPSSQVRSPEDDRHVHLAQLSPAASQQFGGTSVVRNIVEDEHHDGAYTNDKHTPGTWRWPLFRGIA